MTAARPTSEWNAATICGRSVIFMRVASALPAAPPASKAPANISICCIVASAEHLALVLPWLTRRLRYTAYPRTISTIQAEQSRLHSKKRVWMANQSRYCAHQGPGPAPPTRRTPCSRGWRRCRCPRRSDRARCRSWRSTVPTGLRWSRCTGLRLRMLQSQALLREICIPVLTVGLQLRIHRLMLMSSAAGSRLDKTSACDIT